VLTALLAIALTLLLLPAIPTACCAPSQTPARAVYLGVSFLEGKLLSLLLLGIGGVLLGWWALRSLHRVHAAAETRRAAR
jgi:hypothetical protein